MPDLAFDISILGVPELERKLKRLETAAQKRIVRGALRKSASRIRTKIGYNLSGHPVHIITGRTKKAFATAKIQQRTSRGVFRIGVQMPTNEALGIPLDSPWYYPTAIEYGHARAPAHPFIRPAVDDNAESEKTQIASDIAAAILREASRS